MKKLILRLIIISLAIFITTKLVTGVNIDPIWKVVIVGIVITIIDTLIKPIIKILTLPINLLTLGLFSIVINVLIFWYLGSGIIEGFSVVGIKSALFGSIFVSIFDWLISKIIRID